MLTRSAGYTLPSGSIHEQLELFGIEELRLQAEGNSRVLARLDAASTALSETYSAADSIAFTHSGWCMSGLPHRRPASPDAIWHRQNGRLHLLVEPGTILERGQIKTVGVPFGPIARVVLIYIQSRVLEDGTVPLGSSLRRWMKDLRLPITGPVIRRLREQVLRLSRSRVSLHWTDLAGTSTAIADQSPVHLWTGVDPELRHWSDCLVLTPSYLSALMEHRVPLADHAIAYLQGSSLALDLYLWLAYRLRRIRGSEAGRIVPWAALSTQLGACYQREIDLSRHVGRQLQDVLAVYPGARVALHREGLRLWQSPPPVPERRR